MQAAVDLACRSCVGLHLFRAAPGKGNPAIDRHGSAERVGVTLPVGSVHRRVRVVQAGAGDRKRQGEQLGCASPQRERSGRCRCALRGLRHRRRPHADHRQRRARGKTGERGQRSDQVQHRRPLHQQTDRAGDPRIRFPVHPRPDVSAAHRIAPDAVRERWTLHEQVPRSCRERAGQCSFTIECFRAG